VENERTSHASFAFLKTEPKAEPRGGGQSQVQASSPKTFEFQCFLCFRVRWNSTVSSSSCEVGKAYYYLILQSR